MNVTSARNFKLAIATAGMLTLLGTTAACGSSSSSETATDPVGSDTTSATASPSPSASDASSAPSDASTSELCTTLTGLGNDTTPTQLAAALEQVDPPADIPDAAEHGLELFVKVVKTMPDDASGKDFAKAQKSLSAADKADVKAFVEYVDTACAPSTASSPATPSDSAS